MFPEEVTMYRIIIVKMLVSDVLLGTIPPKQTPFGI